MVKKWQILINLFCLIKSSWIIFIFLSAFYLIIWPTTHQSFFLKNSHFENMTGAESLLLDRFSHSVVGWSSSSNHHQGSDLFLLSLPIADRDQTWLYQCFKKYDCFLVTIFGWSSHCVQLTAFFFAGLLLRQMGPATEHYGQNYQNLSKIYETFYCKYMNICLK